MKKLTTFIGIALVSTNALFGGGPFVPAPTPEPDTEPVAPAISEVPEAPETKDFQPYFGGAIGSSSASVSSEAEVCGGCEYDKINQTTTKKDDTILRWGGSDDAATIMALAGVEINDFLAIEGRFTKAVSDFEIKDHQPISFYNAAIYLKPQYKFEMASIYGLIGYGYSSFDFMGNTTSDSGFQYGAGASYDITDEITAFADYTKLYGGGKKISEATTMNDVDSVNVGIIYKP
ncbi:MAG: porin family protein [Epsilonproteobacteria bacterium]|nr:porin family protein [Campylobacterota bacterium]